MLGASFSHGEKVAEGRMRGTRLAGFSPTPTTGYRLQPLIRHASHDTFSLWEKDAPFLFTKPPYAPGPYGNSRRLEGQIGSRPQPDYTHHRAPRRFFVQRRMLE